MAFREMKKDEQVEPGERWVTVTSGMSGYFAVIMWINDEEDSIGPFAEPWETGFGRYGTYAEAQAEALAMAEEENMPYQFKEGA